MPLAAPARSSSVVASSSVVPPPAMHKTTSVHDFHPPAAETEQQNRRHRSASFSASQLLLPNPVVPDPKPLPRAAASIGNANVIGNTSATGAVPAVEFCPYLQNIYGCTNCLPHNSNSSAVGQPITSSAPSRLRKEGPILFELRQIRPSTTPNYNNTSNEQLESVPIGISRGIPGSTSTISTCLSFRPQPQTTQDDLVVLAATGLTTGALVVHTLRLPLNSHESFTDRPTTGSVVYHSTPRQTRAVTCVAWRPPGEYPDQQRFVAVGHVRANSNKDHASGHSGVFGCHVWDVETEGGGANSGQTNAKAPSYRFAKNTGVSSLAWLTDGQLLAVGCQGGTGMTRNISHHNLHLYDMRLRVLGTNSPPSSLRATHSEYSSVSGIMVDPFRPHMFATFSKPNFPDDSNSYKIINTQYNKMKNNEPVRIWDVRNLSQCYAEIRTSGWSDEDSGACADVLGGAIGGVHAVAWSTITEGTLKVASGSTLRSFDTISKGVKKEGGGIKQRPMLTKISRVTVTADKSNNGFVQCVAFPQAEVIAARHSDIEEDSKSRHVTDVASNNFCNHIVKELYPNRIMTVSSSGYVRYMQTFPTAPLSVSGRDGRIAHSLGCHMFMTMPNEGVTGMENTNTRVFDEDISGTMMRRARCLHAANYSTDAGANLQMLSEEVDLLHDAQNSVSDRSDHNFCKDEENTSLINNHLDNETYIIARDMSMRFGEQQKESLVVDPAIPNKSTSRKREELWRLWSWIERVEFLSGPNSLSTIEQQRDVVADNATGNIEDNVIWPARGLIDAGVTKLLGFRDYDQPKEIDCSFDTIVLSHSLGCNTYDSPMRRAALTGCGWMGKFDLRDVLDECEANGHFERSAALAVFHGDIGDAVSALQRGADSIRLDLADDLENIEAKAEYMHSQKYMSSSYRYAEALQLVAMCIAGYSSGSSRSDSWGGVWRRACEDLLRREELSKTFGAARTSQVAYLRAACLFLCAIGRDGEFSKILHDESLSLCDRVAFACRYLPGNTLKSFLDTCIAQCKENGNLEGILITGLDKRGFTLLQSYVDRNADVQTAALVSSRVILPNDWVVERTACEEWLDSYRHLLNSWQLWKSRAMFDVGRADLLRRMKSKYDDEIVATNGRISRRVGGYNYSHNQNSRRQGQSSMQSNSRSTQIEGLSGADFSFALPQFPPQLCARCNFCNTPLPLSTLRRQKGMANSWLSRQKPVLSCCPSCRKPLPRCVICLLPMGCLNPYLELKRERGDRIMASSRTSSGGGYGSVDESLSGLANIPLAEWFTWCMRCKHGGHAHHLIEWFNEHDTCPVSGCDCRCQFDAIKKMKRKGMEPLKNK